MSRRAMAHGFRSRDGLFVDSVTSRGWPQKITRATNLHNKKALFLNVAINATKLARRSGSELTCEDVVPQVMAADQNQSC